MSGESPVRMRTVAAHSGAAFEAGQLGHRNGAAPEGTQVVNAREDPDPRWGIRIHLYSLSSEIHV